MRPPSKFLFAALTLGLAIGLSPTESSGCGPDYPNAYLLRSAEEVASLPTLSFAAELNRLLPRNAGGETEATETEQWLEALHAEGYSDTRARVALSTGDHLNPPAALPKEFHLYAEGARAWRASRPVEAVAAWKKVLELPASSRHFRTIWADYMLGRALCESDPDLALEYLRSVRSVPSPQFAHSRDLSDESLGWEGYIFLRRNECDRALSLYDEQFREGVQSSVRSIQFTLQRLFQAPDESTTGPPVIGAPTVMKSQRILGDGGMCAIAADRQMRSVVTAWFTARGGPQTPWSADATRQFRLWISSLPSDRDLEPDEADRWSWAAYQNGLWGSAAKFAAIAPPDAPASEWVRGMLALREGQVEVAATHLSNAAKAFPLDKALTTDDYPSNEDAVNWTSWELPGPSLAGVQGVLALRRDQYAEALRFFLYSQHWVDASYVAERVLTLEELEAFVRSEKIVPRARSQANSAFDLGDVLARRLVRAGKFDRAREFFSLLTRVTFDGYVSSLRTGYDTSLSSTIRAQALWKAAVIVHDHGMEIQGTALAPDFEVWDGNAEIPELDRIRFSFEQSQSWNLWLSHSVFPETLPQVPASEGEILRVNAVRLPTHRFHYRYRAAELAFLAATLLPNDDPKTAGMLNIAGIWIAKRDPDSAEIFYKTLVFRCANTVLGRRAAEKHWLVDDIPSESSLP